MKEDLDCPLEIAVQIWQNTKARLKARFGDVAQLGERYVRNVEATGSNPVISTTA